MRPVEHPRTYTVHISDDDADLDIGTRTQCGMVLPTSPGSLMRDEDVCINCCRAVASQ